MKDDALSQILKWLRLNAEIYVHADFQGCWAVDTSGQRHVPFHLINSGRSWLHLPGKEPQLLSAGDLVIFPRDAQHFLSSEEETPSIELVDETLEQLGQPGNETGPVTGLTCGYFEFENKAAWPLLDSLPDVIVLELSDTSRMGNTRTLLHLIIAELEENDPGTRVAVNHLTHALFIHILRSQISKGIDQGVLAALFHPRIGQILNQIHSHPEQDWTLDSMARQAGMSRTAFSEQFRELTGQTAMRYLSEWRMLQAAELLRTTEQPIISIAEQCGYHSEIAFRKAFKSITGETPGAVRKKA
ncbi:MAG: AraC family transcriptional regulator [Amphritea sp.]|nr:AraC family transcriptional regulator [Amphritea sp.]